ncbi:histidine ammonia-lyase [Saprospiraceae bacterium]|nr:histidine ammonia-lyase [Saprospiraceae bacterium]
MNEFKYGVDHLTSSIAIGIMRGEIKGVIDDEAKKAIDRAHDIVVKVAGQSDAVYGINTGFGPLCNTKIPKDQTTQLQHNILLSHSVGVGNPISQELSKLMLISKVHSLSQGYSGISSEIVNRIIWHIDNDVIPVVPEQGSVGASGDLAPLSHLFLPLLGEGELYYKNEILPTAQVFEKLKVESVDMHPKSGLALINGTQFILAHAVLVVDTLYNCLSHADIIGGMMVEGLLGSASPFKKILHTTRPHKGNVHVASRLAFFLKNSEILDSHENCDRVQDPYSLRCMPQVHGSSRSAWLHLKEAVEVELNSVTDNPIVFTEDEIISGGSFHGQPLALPLDYACLAASEIGSISDRRSYFSLEGKAEGAPKLLMKDTGINSGFMIVQYTAAALASENKGLCFPSSADSIPTSLGQEDHVSMGSIGGRKALQVCNNVIKILATELLCAAQAFDFRKPLKSSPAIDAVHAEIRKHIDHATKDRIFALDINKAVEIIESRVLLNIVSEKNTGAYSDHDDLFEKY